MAGIKKPDNYFDKLETRSVDERIFNQISGLKENIAFAKNNSAHYSKIFKEISSQEINSINDLKLLPITRKSELIEMQKKNLPFAGMITTEKEKLARIFSSPGPIHDPQGRESDFWNFARGLWAADIRSNDIIHNTFSYHFTPAGFMVDEGARAIGACVIPAGIGQTELQIQSILNLKPTVYAGTPSFLKILLDKSNSLKTPIVSFRKALVGGEALLPDVKNYFIEQKINVKQFYGTADLGLVAYETINNSGLLINENVILEIVKPGTGEQLKNEEVGEVLVTRLSKTYPLFRFSTGDLSMLLNKQSDCGRTSPMMKGWMGRADQTTKVKGMFIHPSQVNDVLKSFPFLTKGRLVVEHDENRLDSMRLICESNDSKNFLKEDIAKKLKSVTKINGTIEFVVKNEIPNDGVIIEDKRKYD